MNKEQARSLVRQTLIQSFDKARFQSFVLELLNEFDESKAFARNTQYIKAAFKNHVARFERLGTYTSPESEKLDVLIVYLTSESKLERARTAIRNFVADHLKERQEKDAGLVAFVSPSEKQWRFSYVKMEYATVEKDSGKVGIETKLTPARRFSYIVGEGESCHTAQTRFLDLLEEPERGEKPNPTLAQLEEAFSVDAVTNEFFKKYAELFEEIKAALDKLAKKDPAIAKEFEKKNVRTADFAKKLMGQIVFLYFIQKKGWLGVGKGKDWGTGPHHFLRRLARGEYGEYDNFFNDILEPLFYSTLAEDRTKEKDWSNTFNCRIPFLNGGLFEPLGEYNWRNTDIMLPNRLFTNNERFDDFSSGTGLLDMFDRYNFTVNEAEPLEKEVAIDPEMLGKVFENLIEENLRKGLGSYYTPREIVHYMCQESLINYLDTALNSVSETIGREKREQAEFGDEKSEQTLLAASVRNEIVPRADIETFVHLGDQISHYEAVETRYAVKMPKSIEKNAWLIDDKLADITVCDPAVGSGAFPVGMMTEIVRARSALTPYFNDPHERSPYFFKRDAIQNCLYGVDIDPGAVEIAKLRLWLSLVVDEEDVKKIKPLPNLDYKIVAGNSLVGFPFKSQRLSEIEDLKTRFFEETNHYRKAKLKQEIDHKLVDCFASSKKVLGYEVNFDFEIYFSEVFHRKGGFDVVIANPPYISKNALQKQSVELLELLRASYETAKGRDFDLFGCFIEKGIAILRRRGTLTFIVASGWYTGPGFGALRRFVACKTDPQVFINLPYDMFSAAWVDTTILILTRRTQPTSWPREISCHVRLRNFDKREKITGRKDFERQFEVVDITEWFTPGSDLFLTRSTSRIIGLIRRMEANCRPLGELADIQRGVTPFELTAEPVNRHSKRAFAGTVRRYVLDPGPTRFIRFDGTLAEPKPVRYFIGPRVLLRELISRQFRLQATFTDEDFVTNKSMQTVLSLSDGPLLKYLLGCINSTLLSWLFLQRSNVGHRDDFPKIVLKETRALPIPDGPKEQQLKIVRLVDRILVAKQRDVEADMSSLEREIDQLVYTLYGLTPEEIQIVEGSTTR
jgi:type I restriction-modification system DNA methylase subunit